MAREMKNSGIEWIGMVPEDWQLVPIKYLASYNDETLGENTDLEYEFDYIEIGSVEYGKGITQVEHLKFANAPSRARRIVRQNDIIVSTVRTYLRAIATVQDSDRVQIASTGFVVIRAKAVDPEYLRYSILSESFISMVEAYSTGISYPAINSSVVVGFKIPVPCGAEQKRIAMYLNEQCSALDNILSKTRASIEEYKKLKQAIITQVITKGVRGDREMKDSGIEWIGEIPTEWNIVALKVLCSMNAGKTLSSEQIFDEGEYAVYGGNGLRGYYSQYNNQGSYLLVGRQGALCGNVHRVDGVFWATEHAVVTKCSKLSNRDFLYYLLIGMNLNQYASNTAAQPGLSVGEIINVRTLLVPIKEQQEIADYLDKMCEEIDALIVKKTALMDEMENYKKSIIYEYVTGKKEVSV